MGAMEDETRLYLVVYTVTTAKPDHNFLRLNV
jgi:hypothetical protein